MTPQEADRAVAQRVREARIFAGLTQAELGALLGVSNQQIHRYETSINRIPAGRLWRIAVVLAVPVEHLFPPADEKAAAIAPVVHHVAAQKIVSILRHEMSPERVRALLTVARAFAGERL